MLTKEKQDKLQEMLDYEPHITKWRKETLVKLLTDICPRIAQCPYKNRYAQQAADLISVCSHPFQPSASSFNLYWSQYEAHVMDEIIFSSLHEELPKK